MKMGLGRLVQKKTLFPDQFHLLNIYGKSRERFFQKSFTRGSLRDKAINCQSIESNTKRRLSSEEEKLNY